MSACEPSLARRSSDGGGGRAARPPLSSETHLLPEVDLAARLLHLVRASLGLLAISASAAVGRLLLAVGLLRLLTVGCLLGLLLLTVGGLTTVGRLVVSRLGVAGKDQQGKSSPSATCARP